MKKALIAIAVMTATTSASAIELYNQNDVSVNLGGSIEVFYGNDFDDSTLVQQLGDADFSFDTRFAVNEEFSIGGFWEFDGTGGDAALGDAFIGLYSKTYGTLLAGKTATILDDIGIGADYQYGLTSAVSDIDFGGTQVLRYELDSGTIYGGVALMQNHGLDNAPGNEDGTLIDAKIGVRVADFDFVAFAGQEDMIDKDNKASIFALEGRYALDNLNVELGYYNVSDSDNTRGGDTVAFGADYSLDAWLFAAGVANVSPEGESSFAEGFINAGYGIAPNTTIYTEVGFNNDDAKSESVAFAIGISAEF